MHIKKFGISENSGKNGNSDYLNFYILFIKHHGK